MGMSLEDGHSTPRYAAVFAFGVLVGTGVRLVAWVIPTRLVDALRARLLP